MKTEKYICDIKDCNNIPDKENIGVSLQVIFTTDQTEGRSTKPYLSLEKIDICNDCVKKVIEGAAIYANGAMGHNTYFFKNSKP